MKVLVVGRKHREWTNEEDGLIYEALARGITHAEAARVVYNALGYRSLASIEQRIMKLRKASQ